MLIARGGAETGLATLLSLLGCSDRFSLEGFRDTLLSNLLDGASFDISTADAPRVVRIRYKPFQAPDGGLERLDGLFVDVTSQHETLRVCSSPEVAARVNNLGSFTGRICPSTLRILAICEAVCCKMTMRLRGFRLFQVQTCRGLERVMSLFAYPQC